MNPVEIRLPKLRAAVIGAGVFGRLHAQKYKANPDVELVGIVDRSMSAAAAAARDIGCRPFLDSYSLIGEVDIVTVATPAVAHGAVTHLLQSGIDAYVEKPVAATLAVADRIVAAAEAYQRVLQVGHQERFVFAAMGLMRRRVAPISVTCHRAGVWSERGTDVNVALDLMTHDVDLLHQIVPGSIVDVRARARSKAGNFGDEVSADLSFTNGTTARLFASRMAPERKRFMHIVYPDGEVEIDFIARTLRNTTPERLSTIFSSAGANDKVMTDPLGYAVGQFVSCARTRQQPLVTARDGRRSLETALRILHAARSPATREDAVAA